MVITPMKRYLASLAIKKIQNQATMIYHCTPTRMTKIKMTDLPNAGEDVE